MSERVNLKVSINEQATLDTSKKKRMNLNVILFIGTLIIFFLLNFFNTNDSLISAKENRTLAEMPVLNWNDLISGKYIQDFELYYSDSFPFREFFITCGSVLLEMKGFSGEDEVTIVESKGNYVVVGNKAMSLYYYTPEAAEQYSRALNTFRGKIGNEVEIYSLIVPTAIEYFLDEKYSDMAPPQSESIQFVNDLLDESIHSIPAYKMLEENKNEYTYFRTDHHWTALGAYYAYTSFMEQIGESAIPLGQYSEKKAGQFLGTTYNATLNKNLAADPDTIFIYEPFMEYTFKALKNGKLTQGEVIQENKEGYGKFLGGDFPSAHIETEQEGDRILIIKDSYANSFIPFLIPHYEQIHFIDLRHYSGDVYEYITKHEIDEVMFLNSSSVTSHTGYTRILEEKLNLN
ncbi:DHHW family protein [Chengkuizengella sp. SCS-71B]|uniref:DHHW family protein n=1 Tax=Chengkuizengella sp. SCS-71B TaxID=3115290 RepID=UPI0032C247E6